jgi:LuxR family transcriptional regulator, quorum-sensing system regulator CinR
MGLMEGSALEAVSESSTVEEAVVAVRDIYNLDNATYHLAQVASSDVDGPYVKSTYPAEWLTRYLLQGYVRVDPVVKAGFSRQLPFDWRELTLTADAAELMAEAQRFGLGGNGYSIPLVDKLARRALFSLNSKMPGDAWSLFISENATTLAEIAHKIHRKAIAELYGAKDPLPSLGPRELECLAWTAQGKETKDIAEILGISEHTVTGYLKAARYKLDCSNIAGTVAKAIRLRLINP